MKFSHLVNPENNSKNPVNAESATNLSPAWLPNVHHTSLSY